MINPYYVLRDEMLNILLEHVVYIINQWTAVAGASQVRYTYFTEMTLVFIIYIAFRSNTVLFKKYI
jgi:hypothetical protein